MKLRNTLTARRWLLALVALLPLPSLAVDDVVKSPNDKRAYEFFTLPNALKVLIVSDPEADKAAAALDVHIGSASDPAERQGLAHFLEHMLFLGTEKYPQPGEYKAFISAHGGAHNAYTALEDTNYFFEIDKDYLEPTLDRFAQFFVAPLFTAKYVDSERQVVHSEYQSKLRQDGWGLRSAQKQVANPKHPYAGFNVGSTTTLADRPGSDVRTELMAFYQNHYSANLMTLVVLGKEPLAQLKQWVTEKFTAVENRNIQPFTTQEPLFAPGRLPVRLDVVPVKDKSSLLLTFPIPSTRPYYHSKPVDYIANLLGHEGKGSLLALLKAEGWADKLWAGGDEDNVNQALFNVGIELTQSGLAHTDAIAALVFQYLRLIEQAGIQEWIFAEQRKLADIDFRFQEKSDSLSYVRGLAEALHDYPAADVLRGPYALDNFDPDAIRHFLAELKPTNVLLTVSAKGLETDAKDPWFDTPYRVVALTESTLAGWSAVPTDARLALPEANPFIPENLALKPAADATPKPVALRRDTAMEFWHQQDQTFRIPRADLYFALRSPIASDTPEHAVLTELYAKLVEDMLSETTYPAYVARLEFKIYKQIRGISVRISGYSDKQDLLLERILANMRAPAIKPERFAVIKEELLRNLKNDVNNPPYQRANTEVANLLIESYWSEAERLHALAAIEMQDLQRFIPQFLSALSVAVLAHGNVSRDEALSFARTLDANLLAQAKPTAVARGKLVRLDGAGPYIRQLDGGHDDAAVAVYFQGPDKSYESQARFLLLAQILESPFFEELRTEKKLGYIVSAAPMPLLDVPGIAFVVQSPSADPATLEGHIEQFIGGYGQTIAKLSSEAFERHRASLLGNILAKDENLQARSDRYWTEIDRANLTFDYQDRLADAVRAASQTDLADSYRRFLLDAPQRRLVVRADGVHPSATPAAQRDQTEQFIVDPLAFKRDKGVFPG